MRIEATVPESRGQAVQELAEQLGLSKSQIVDEALALFLKAVIELRRGRRLVTQDPDNHQSTCELTTPTLTTLEWALTVGTIELPEAALSKMQALVEAAPAPGARLRAAAKRHK